MTRTLKVKALLLTLLFFSTAHATVLQGQVVGVADGDTLTLLDPSKAQHRIRLAGIDAPEKAQAFGSRSKQSLSSMAFNRQATVETNKIDRYGRLVGNVLVDGKDVNLMQIERGMAWFYSVYQAEQSVEDRASYAEAEREAKKGRRGLWVDAQPLPPWDFRRDNRLQKGETPKR